MAVPQIIQGFTWELVTTSLSCSLYSNFLEIKRKNFQEMLNSNYSNYLYCNIYFSSLSYRAWQSWDNQCRKICVIWLRENQLQTSFFCYNSKRANILSYCHDSYFQNCILIWLYKKDIYTWHWHKLKYNFFSTNNLILSAFLTTTINR